MKLILVVALYCKFTSSANRLGAAQVRLAVKVCNFGVDAFAGGENLSRAWAI